MKPRPEEVALLWSQGALDLTAFGLFVAGRVLGSDPLSLAGFIIYVVVNVVQLFGGILTPAGGFITIIIAVVGAPFFSPWWLGLGWYFTVMGALGIPQSLMQVINPVGMWQRRVYPRLSPLEKLERTRDAEW